MFIALIFPFPLMNLREVKGLIHLVKTYQSYGFFNFYLA